MTDAPDVFAGWTVVELCQGFGAGTLAAKLLADFGCVVGKIEHPAGDSLRGEVPAAASALTLFDLVNGGKHLACIDLDAVAARAPLDALLAAADILIVDQWGLAVLAALDPGVPVAQRYPALTIAACTPYGTSGAQADWAATEECIQAISGVMSTTGHPGHPSVRVAGALATHTAAMHAVTSVLAQMHAKRAGAGRGGTLDVALFDAAISLLTAGFPSYFLTGESPQGIGNRHSMAAPWNTYACSDGWVVVCAGNEPTWQRLVATLARPDLAAHPDYATQALRVAHVDALDAEVESWTRERSVAEVERTLDAQGIPCGPILALADVIAHPQTATRELLRRTGGSTASGGVFHVDHRALGEGVTLQACGSGTRALLVRHLGVDPQRYRQWLAAGVVRETGVERDAVAA